MANPKIVHDPDLGDVVFRRSGRARRYILRINAKGVAVTIPLGGNFACAEQFFQENREQLIQKMEAFRHVRARHALPLPTPQSIENLRRQANQFLPNQLQGLAQQHGFHYQSLSIRQSRTRWGSCSSGKNISLSLYLMLLPAHLIEYVLLHELCHTVEMNHSPAFWALLDRHTNGRAKALKKELRGYAL